MHPGKGGPDHPGSEGGSQEEAGGDEAGGADEGGEKGAVDGSRLPCYVFYICPLTNKNPNANKLSWAIN